MDNQPIDEINIPSKLSIGLSFFGGATRARQLIDGAALGPEALRAIGEAFDTVWAEIAGRFGADPVVVDAARIKLANAVLSIAHEDSRDVEVLKQAALQRMAMDYREPS